MSGAVVLCGLRPADSPIVRESTDNRIVRNSDEIDQGTIASGLQSDQDIRIGTADHTDIRMIQYFIY